MDHNPGDILPIEAMARIENWGNGVSISFRQVIYGVEQRLAKPIVFDKVESNYAVMEPCMRLDMRAAQQLMDELWLCGLRPTEGSGSAGALAATQAHLKDMQRIVFKDFKQTIGLS